MIHTNTFDAEPRRTGDNWREQVGHRDSQPTPGRDSPRHRGRSRGDAKPDDGSGHPDDSYRCLVEDNPAAIFVHEAGRVVYANGAAFRWTGARSADQVVGRLITELIHPEAILVALTRLTAPSPSDEPAQPVASVMFRCDGTSLDVEAVTVSTKWAGRHAYQTVLRDTSAEKAAQATVTPQAALIEHTPDAIIVTDWHGAVVQWNPAAENLYRRSADVALGRSVSEAVGAPLDLGAIVASRATAHTTHHTAAGSPLTVRVTAARIDSGYLIICSESSSQHFQAVVSSLDSGIVVIRRDGNIASINPAAARILGYGAGHFPDSYFERAQDFPLFDTDGHVLPATQRPANVTLRTGQPVYGRVLGLRRHDGRQMWISFTTTLLDTKDAEHSAVLMSLSDVTTEHMANQQLRRRAHQDALTGLPNRTRALALITAALTPSENPDLAALMFIDIDQLKQVNDSLGHHAGDEVLRSCAEVLQGVLRFSDTLTRVGGDEFVVLVAAPATAEHLEQLAVRLHKALKNNPTSVDGKSIHTSASIGIAMIDSACALSPADILRRADTAMYQAKSSGPGQTRFYVPRNGSRHRPRFDAPPNTAAGDFPDAND